MCPMISNNIKDCFEECMKRGLKRHKILWKVAASAAIYYAIIEEKPIRPS